jgi:hypothetical protein
MRRPSPRLGRLAHSCTGWAERKLPPDFLCDRCRGRGCLSCRPARSSARNGADDKRKRNSSRQLARPGVGPGRRLWPVWRHICVPMCAISAPRRRPSRTNGMPGLAGQGKHRRRSELRLDTCMHYAIGAEQTNARSGHRIWLRLMSCRRRRRAVRNCNCRAVVVLWSLFVAVHSRRSHRPT